MKHGQILLGNLVLTILISLVLMTLIPFVQIIWIPLILIILTSSRSHWIWALSGSASTTTTTRAQMKQWQTLTRCLRIAKHTIQRIMKSSSCERMLSDSIIQRWRSFPKKMKSPSMRMTCFILKWPAVKMTWVMMTFFEEQESLRWNGNSFQPLVLFTWTALYVWLRWSPWDYICRHIIAQNLRK